MMDALAEPAAKRRRHLSVQSWGEVFQRFAGAGLTVEAFCRREGLCRSTFPRWRSKLSAPSRRLPAVAAKAGVNDKLAAAFVELGALGNAPEPAPALAPTLPLLDLRLDLGGGVSLHLARR